MSIAHVFSSCALGELQALKKFLEEERIEYKGKKMSLTKYLEKLKVERRCRAKGEGIDTLNEVAEK